jgi:hypothetical protein
MYTVTPKNTLLSNGNLVSAVFNAVMAGTMWSGFAH